MTLFLWDLLLFQKYHDCPFLNVSHSFFAGRQRHAHQRMTKRKRRRSLALMTMNKKTPKTTSKVRQKKNQPIFQQLVWYFPCNLGSPFWIRYNANFCLLTYKIVKIFFSFLIKIWFLKVFRVGHFTKSTFFALVLLWGPF